jgi:DNA repair exonuclease SbcCD ATPase subunit
MRYIRAIFKNYIGFYNGMGLDIVDIDFGKCMHNIILIEGANGSGKSTLLSHLNPFPDGSSSFIPEKTAEKDLVLFDNGDTYSIQIISPADIKGRKTTKAYIQKNGIELNQNGNISSYKDIIFSEFELDSNYISLSRLSCNERGLGDKTPAERKRFVSSIIDNLEVYNTMYKTLNKKSLVYKSQINTLHTKIQNIGNKTNLEERLANLSNRESEINATIMSLNNKIVTLQAKNSIEDDELKLIESATNKTNELKSQLDSIQVQLDSYYNRTKIKPVDISTKYNSDTNLYSNLSAKYEEMNKAWKDKSNRLSDVSNNILSIEAELSKTDTDDTIYDKYKESTNKLNEYISELERLDIPNDTNLIYPLTYIVSFCEDFIEFLDKFNDDMTLSDIKFVMSTLSSNYIADLSKTQKKYIDESEAKNKELIELQSKIKILSALESRPDNCTIDSCPFINSALELYNTGNDYIEQLDALQSEILALSDKITEIQEIIDFSKDKLSKKMELDAIRDLILKNKDNIELIYPNFVDNFDSRLSNGYSFNEIRDNTRLIDARNLLLLIQSETNNNKILETEYNGYRDKIKILNSSKVLLEKLKAEETELISDIKESKLKVDEINKTLTELKSSINTESLYNDTYNKYLDIKKEYDDADKIVESYRQKSAKALESLSMINEYRTNIDNLAREMDPIMKDISAISGSLTLLESYYNEYNEYKSNYNMIETLKKYCSPTGGGIQTLFMQIYMSRTKDTANKVLAMLFNGSYQLLDFIINANEFRIPFIGEGLPVDDISSGSSSQIAMMSMIINLVLLNQGSSKLNIAQLDEIDAPLDSYNRSNFVNILFHSINILNIEQLFLISHSIEVDNTFADIIRLKCDNSYDSVKGNIIWDYDNVIKQ